MEANHMRMWLTGLFVLTFLFFVLVAKGIDSFENESLWKFIKGLGIFIVLYAFVNIIITIWL